MHWDVRNVPVLNTVFCVKMIRIEFLTHLQDNVIVVKDLKFLKQTNKFAKNVSTTKIPASVLVQLTLNLTKIFKYVKKSLIPLKEIAPPYSLLDS